MSELWQAIDNQLKNEEAERKAMLAAGQPEEDEDEGENVTVIRKSPQSFAAGSPAYWKAVANQTVRTYVTLTVEPKTQDAVTASVRSGPVKTDACQGDQGKNSVLTFLDVDLLGESQGCGQQPLLRKSFCPSIELMRKLVHGSMNGRGSQKENDLGECTKVPDGDIIAIHVGPERSNKKDAKSLFRLSTNAKAKQDSEIKETMVAFKDDTVRARKQRVKGAYSCRSELLLISSTALSNAVPEKKFEHHQGSCSSDVFGLVNALAPAEMWHTTRTWFFILMFEVSKL